MRPLLIVVPADTQKWRVELANGDHSFDGVATDPAQLDALYLSQVNTPSEALMYTENGDLEKVNRYK